MRLQDRRRHPRSGNAYRRSRLLTEVRNPFLTVATIQTILLSARKTSKSFPNADAIIMQAQDRPSTDPLNALYPILQNSGALWGSHFPDKFGCISTRLGKCNTTGLIAAYPPRFGDIMHTSSENFSNASSMILASKSFCRKGHLPCQCLLSLQSLTRFQCATVFPLACTFNIGFFVVTFRWPLIHWKKKKNH